MATPRRVLASAIFALLAWSLPSTAALAAGGDTVVRAQAGARPDAQDQIVLSGSVTVPRGKQAGEIVVFHGSATVAGIALGDVVVLDGPIVVNGQVSGSVIAITGDVTLGPGAQVRGDVMAGGSVEADPGAQVSGQVRDGVRYSLRGSLESVARVLLWLALSVSTLILGLALVLLAPRAADAVHLAATTGPWPSIGWAFVALVGLPVLAVLLVISILGLPLGLAILLGLGLLLLLGFAWTAWIVGRLLWRPPRSRWPALLFGWAIASALTLVPYAGAVLWFAGSAFGLGAASVATWRARGHRGRHRAGPPSQPVLAAPPAETTTMDEEVGHA